MLKIEHLTKKYDQYKAVDDLSLHIERGHIYGFIGHNGAGKTTTLKAVAGIMPFDEGEIIINGKSMKSHALECKQIMAYIPDNPDLYEYLTGIQYLNFVAQLKKVKKKERKAQVEEVIRMTELGEYENRLIKFLSKGYKQRVGLAQALLGSPELLILDEPTVGLDPKQIINMRELIKELAKTHTIILSSHILSEISAVCDSVIIIDRGKVIAQGTAEELEEHLGDKDALNIIVKGEKEDIDMVASECGYFSSYELESKDDGQWLIKAEIVESEEDVRDQLFFYFAEKKIPILNMEHETKSLEDVFLQLTGKENEVK